MLLKTDEKMKHLVKYDSELWTKLFGKWLTSCGKNGKNIKQQSNIFIRMEKNHGFWLFFLQKTKLYKSSNCLMNQKCIFMQDFFFQSNNTRLEKVAAAAAIFCCSCHFTYHNRLKMKGCNFDALLKHFKSSKIKL